MKNLVIACLSVALFAAILWGVMLTQEGKQDLSDPTVALAAGEAREYSTKDTPEAPVVEALPPEIPAEEEAPVEDPIEEEAPVEEEALIEEMSENPYGMYLVTEDWMKEAGGFCLERDGELYSVASFVPIDNIIRYKVGYNVVGGSPDASLFMMDWEKSKLPTDDPFCYITSGDIPLLKIKRDEVIRGYQIDALRLLKTEFVGYTIDVTEMPDETFPVLNHNMTQEDERKAKVRKDKIEVTDAFENPVEDFRRLNYGEEYICSWYVGTEYNEARKLADCKAFRSFDKNHVPEAEGITIAGDLTKNGYATFDISSLEPGTYISTQWAAVFEITD